MRLFLRLAWRNLWRHRRRTVIVIFSIGLTLAMMMMYDGLVDGFNDAIYGNAIRVLGGNIQVHAAGYHDKNDDNPLLAVPNDQVVIDAATKLPEVVAASRRITTGGMTTSREGAFSVSIVGIEPEKEQTISLLAQKVAAGRFLTSDDRDVIYIGKGLADAMDVSVGDRISLVGRGEHQQMRSRTMTVAGIYDVGMAAIEKRSVYMSLAEAQDLYGMSGQVTEVMITLQRIGQEEAVIQSLSKVLPGYELDTWQTNYPEMTQALETKGGIMNIFSVIILLIAGIGILNLLLMAVYERTREIGVMGALGMRPRQISILFLLEGALMGLVGVAFGIVLGLALNAYLMKVGIDYSSFTGVTDYTALISGRVYSSLGIGKLFQRSLTAVVIAVLASFIPAREAAQNEPAKALHYV
jgi:ABC-type lipoprotein release transport system permease subunit